VKRAVVLVLALAVGAGACSKDSAKQSKGAETTASSAATGATPTTAAPASGPVTDADVTDVDQILHRLGSELDRLDSDMATGEGDVQ
jgi:ABC-type transport system substrate-binding protein